MNELYGELEAEKIAKDNTIARKIVTEINHFGVNERQRWLVIFSLALELENVEDMKELTSFIRERKGNEIFVSRIFSIDEENERAQ